MFTKLLIANRGEIACRVIRTAREMGLATVAVYSDADAGAAHVEAADEAVRIGPAPARESYLRGEAIVAAARASGADAVHPGYGFLAENAQFAEGCEAAGLVFVGPPVAAIRAMGRKDVALATMDAAGVPCLPGYRESAQDDAALDTAAATLGFPLIIKPSAGGGGKGMRVVTVAQGLGEALAGARREAASAFGSGDLILERYLPRPRHVEVQVFCDTHGGAIHLYERDCSIQRRHQKIVEEAPAPGLPSPLRTRMGEAAVQAARAIGYVGAGTVEFLLDAPQHGPVPEDAPFHFMEMNTRLQVEHPVTEMVIGVDLVEWQLRVAAGEALPLEQEAIAPRGHAIEVRLYAEDPAQGFLPSTGRITVFDPPPGGPRVRLDTGVRRGDEVGVHYDPMLAKLVVHGENRSGAVRLLGRALADFRVAGPATNLAFLRRVAALPAFAEGHVDTGFVPRWEDELLARDQEAFDEALLLGALHAVLHGDRERERRGAASGDPNSPWHRLHDWRANGPARREVRLHGPDGARVVTVEAGAESFVASLENHTYVLEACLNEAGDLVVTAQGRREVISVHRNGWRLEVLRPEGNVVLELDDPDARSRGAEAEGGQLTAPMPGRIVAVMVEEGQTVEAGDDLVVLEAMKMEHTISAPAPGKVLRVDYAVGDQVVEGAELIAMEIAES